MTMKGKPPLSPVAVIQLVTIAAVRRRLSSIRNHICRHAAQLQQLQLFAGDFRSRSVILELGYCASGSVLLWLRWDALWAKRQTAGILARRCYRRFTLAVLSAAPGRAARATPNCERNPNRRRAIAQTNSCYQPNIEREVRTTMLA
jgi:hypothetical protein